MPQPYAQAQAPVPVSPGGGSQSYDSGELSPGYKSREQDRFLPIANVGRIMKKSLPTNGKIAKDSKEIMQECVSEFISFITSEASDKCQREKRKTINGDDILWAIATLGFEEYMEPLKVYLARYREMEGETKGSSKGGDVFAMTDGQPSSTLQQPNYEPQDVNYGNSQPSQQLNYEPQDVNYGNSQPSQQLNYEPQDANYGNSQQMMVPVQRLE